MKPLTRTRLIGYVAMAFCVIGYGAFAGALVLGKMDVLTTTQSLVFGGVAAVIGEIGLWVGAACLGLTLFKRRKAMLNRLLGRKTAPETPSTKGA